MTDRPKGWYPDPATPGDERYWDGSRWTGQRRFGSFEAASPEFVRPGKARKQTKQTGLGAIPEETPWWRRRWVIVAAAVVVLLIVIWLSSRGSDEPEFDPDRIPIGVGVVLVENVLSVLPR